MRLIISNSLFSGKLLQIYVCRVVNLTCYVCISFILFLKTVRLNIKQNGLMKKHGDIYRKNVRFKFRLVDFQKCQSSFGRPKKILVGDSPNCKYMSLFSMMNRMSAIPIFGSLERHRATMELSHVHTEFACAIDHGKVYVYWRASPYSFSFFPLSTMS